MWKSLKICRKRGLLEPEKLKEMMLIDFKRRSQVHAKVSYTANFSVLKKRKNAISFIEKTSYDYYD